ncbi:MAG: hypothetical protein HN348_24050, partial [Proteobacteria bacterium]|nr:hypothetical protein [Pseudomonadota bacterium]
PWPPDVDEMHPLREMLDFADEPMLSGPPEQGLAPPKKGAVFWNGLLLTDAKVRAETPGLIQAFDKDGLLVKAYWQDGSMFQPDLLGAVAEVKPPKWYVPFEAATAVAAGEEMYSSGSNIIEIVEEAAVVEVEPTTIVEETTPDVEENKEPELVIPELAVNLALEQLPERIVEWSLGTEGAIVAEPTGEFIPVEIPDAVVTAPDPDHEEAVVVPTVTPDPIDENPEENPEENPDALTDDNPEENPEENPDESPVENPEENPDALADDNPEENPEENPDENPVENPEENRSENSDAVADTNGDAKDPIKSPIIDNGNPIPGNTFNLKVPNAAIGGGLALIAGTMWAIAGASKASMAKATTQDQLLAKRSTANVLVLASAATGAAAIGIGVTAFISDDGAMIGFKKKF